MDRVSQIEITGIASAVNDMATNYFATHATDVTPFETTVNFYDENPEIARLKAKELRVSLCEYYKSSQVHVSIKDTRYMIQIDRP